MKIKIDEKPQRITVYTTEHVVDWLKAKAESERRSVSNLLTKIVEGEMDKEWKAN